MYHLLYSTSFSLKGDGASWRVMNDPGCEHGLGGRWGVVQGTVRSERVVLLSPSFAEHLGPPENVENFPVE
jgi:hypothetical protein